MGGVVSIFRPRKSKAQKRVEAATARNNIVEADRKKREEKEKEEKKSAALKLAQISTGAGGILSEAKTSRKKLLGN